MSLDSLDSIGQASSHPPPKSGQQNGPEQPTKGWNLLLGRQPEATIMPGPTKPGVGTVKGN
ncbi:hypothetical protein E4U55_001253 [Claviceps digitariae]|nr:hypothetical protein E4U55_001253 [Claviceps digitariae]